MPDKDHAGFEDDRPEEPRRTQEGGDASMNAERHAITALCEQVEHFIAEKPLRALALAFLVGLVFGRVIL